MISRHKNIIIEFAIMINVAQDFHCPAYKYYDS